MGLGAPELLVVPAEVGRFRRRPFSGRFALVMPPAERSQVGFSMVITSHNVIHVARRLRAPRAVLVAVGAPEAVSAEDSCAELRPVLGEACSPIRPLPLGHFAPSPPSGTWNRGPATCARRGGLAWTRAAQG